jgi:hypothetical protein
MDTLPVIPDTYGYGPAVLGQTQEILQDHKDHKASRVFKEKQVLLARRAFRVKQDLLAHRVSKVNQGLKAQLDLLDLKVKQGQQVRKARLVLQDHKDHKVKLALQARPQISHWIRLVQSPLQTQQFQMY